MTTGIRFPPGPETVMTNVLGALGGNLEHYERLAVADIYDEAKGDKALEYAIAIFGPFILECRDALQAAIDEAALIQEWPKEKLLHAAANVDLPTILRTPGALHGLSDDALRILLINSTFLAELDRTGLGRVEIALFRFQPDGTRTMRRLGIRDPGPETKIPAEPSQQN